MRYTQREAELKFPNVVFEGGAWIGQGARIGQGAWIGQDAWIGQGARIGQDARIDVIHSLYTGNISSIKPLLIRIGCEVHSVSDWLENGIYIATKHNESIWWEQTGKAMLTFLISEASHLDNKEGV